MFTLQLRNLDDTNRLGSQLARAMVCDRATPGLGPPSTFTQLGIVVGLTGTLGAGKTNLAQAVISSFGVPRTEITSPTFSLVQTYEIERPDSGAMVINHLDAYRIADEDEFMELGVEDILGQPRSLSLVEWAGKVKNCLPAETLWIDIEYCSTSSRIARFSSPGEHWNVWISEFLRAYADSSPPANDT